MKRFALVLALLPMSMIGAISGQWHGHADATNRKTHGKEMIGIYVTLSQNGTQLTGTAGTHGAVVPIENGTVNGSAITFDIKEGGSGPANKTTFALTQSGANLSGLVTLFDGERLSVVLTPVK